jgi:hypothetical protein
LVLRLLDRDSRKNPKLAKSDRAGKGYVSIGLSLAPSNVSGYQVCPFASKGCAAACIFESGYASFLPSINPARIAKTRAWFQARAAFKEMLVRELRNAVKNAAQKGKRLAVRLDVFSDIS